MNSSSIGRRHRRKSSSAKVGDRPPQQQQQQQHYYNDASPDNSKSSRGGFWSYLNRIRQQVVANNGGQRGEGKGHDYDKRNSDNNNTINNNSSSSGIGDTLLPKTYKPKSSSTKTAMSQSPPSPLSSSPNNNNNNNRPSMTKSSSTKKLNNTISPTTRACMNINNSFLLGTIDNKRRYRRKKHTILYRIFWSSIPRRLLVGFLVLYLFLFHLLVPLASYLLFGITLHHVDHGSITGEDILARLNHDPRFDTASLPSIKKEQIMVHNIDITRSSFEYNKHHHSETTKRATILEEIVPKWFHRNDIIIATTTTGAENTINANNQKKEKDRNNTANSNGNANAAHDDDGKKKKKQSEEKEVEETKQKKEQQPEKKKKKKKTNNKDNNAVVAVASSVGGDTGAGGDTNANEEKNDVNVDDGGDDDGNGSSDGDDGGDDDDGDDDVNTDGVVSDSNAGNNNNKQQQQQQQQQQMKKKRYHTVAGGNSHNNNRILEVSGGIAEEIPENDNGNGSDSGSLLLPIRTIHNQQNLAAMYSSCGTTTTTTTDDTPAAAANNTTVTSVTTTTTTTTTLVVQTSIDRMWILKETCQRWNIDPIIAVVFVPHSESFIGDTEGTNERKTLLNTLERTEQELLGGSGSGGSGSGGNGENNGIKSPAVGCSNLYIIRYIADPIESIEGRYPVNRMRNVGLDYVTTNQVLMIDIDFIPSQDLDTTIKDATQQQQQHQKKLNHATTNIALVVPAFERRKPIDCLDEVSCSKYLKDSDSNNFLPHTFEELQKCYNTKASINNTESDCIVFQSEYNWDGHSTTRSKQWINEQFYDNSNNNNSKDNDSDKSFRKIPCFDTARYEPYVVLQWCPSTKLSTTIKVGGVVDVNDNDNNNNNNNIGIGIAPLSPYYDERFYGYGKNKIELISHLRYMSYAFHILPKGYIIHNPHVESKTKYRWNDIQHSSLHKTMDTLYNTIFMKELYKMYSSHTHTTTTGNSIVELCEQKR